MVDTIKSAFVALWNDDVYKKILLGIIAVILALWFSIKKTEDKLKRARASARNARKKAKSAYRYVRRK